MTNKAQLLLKEYEDMLRAEGDDMNIEDIKETNTNIFDDDPDMKEIQ